MILAHPGTTAAKTVQSAWDNLWIMLGANLSTFPGVVVFVLLAVALVPEVRHAITQTPVGNWLVGLAALAETVLPPLSWAPPHPQYHLQLVLAAIIVVVPVLVALLTEARTKPVALAFLGVNAALSAFRYTRYAGY